MKKLFIVALLLVGSVTSFAQFGHAVVAGSKTITNTDTLSATITATAGYNAIGIEVNANLVSGTIPAKVYLAKSEDGLTYQITDSTTFTAVRTSSFSTTTYTHTALFEKQTVPFVYYRVWVVSAATVSCPTQILYTLRKNITL